MMTLETSNPIDILNGQQDMSSGAINSKCEDSPLSMEGISGEVTFNTKSLNISRLMEIIGFLSGF